MLDGVISNVTKAAEIINDVKNVVDTAQNIASTVTNFNPTAAFNNREGFLSNQVFDAGAVSRFNLERTFEARAPQGFQENYPARQGLQFSETKSASSLAYRAQAGEVYQFPDGKQWRVVDVREDNDSGFRAIALQPTDPNDTRTVVAFAGTNPTSLADWKNNFGQGTGGVPEQYQQAAQMARDYAAQYGDNLIFTGHSLGGGLASYASIETGRPATAINSAPLSTGTFPERLRNDPAVNSRITQYYVPGEILTDLANNGIVRNAPFISNVRPGEQIAIPGGKREMPSIPFTKFDDLYNLGISVYNHTLDHLALDVPDPVKVN